MLLRGVNYDCIMNDRLRVVSSVDDIGRSHNWGVLGRGVHGDFGVQLDIWWVNYVREFGEVALNVHLVTRFSNCVRLVANCRGNIISLFYDDGVDFIWRNNNIVSN
jgi:hypothetical protein